MARLRQQSVFDAELIRPPACSASKPRRTARLPPANSQLSRSHSSSTTRGHLYRIATSAKLGLLTPPPRVPYMAARRPRRTSLRAAASCRTPERSPNSLRERSTGTRSTRTRPTVRCGHSAPPSSSRRDSVSRVSLPRAFTGRPAVSNKGSLPVSSRRRSTRSCPRTRLMPQSQARAFGGDRGVHDLPGQRPVERHRGAAFCVVSTQIRCDERGDERAGGSVAQLGVGRRR